MKFYLFILASTLCTALFSCKKDNNQSIPFSGNISINYPTENDTVTGGTSFVVTATITANQEMHGYHIVVYNQNDQSVVYENQYHEHASTFAVSETVAHTLSTTTPLRLVIEGAGDHESEIFSKEVIFQYVP